MMPPTLDEGSPTFSPIGHIEEQSLEGPLVFFLLGHTEVQSSPAM